MKFVAMPDALVPEVVAVQVMEELQELTEFHVPDPERLVEHLVRQAGEVSAANVSFSRKLRGRLGREWLYAFMRHWLAAELKRTHPAVFHRLPPRYAVGDPDTGRRSPVKLAHMMNCSG